MLDAVTQEIVIVSIALAAVAFGFINGLVITRASIVPPESAEEAAEDEEQQNIKTALSDEKLKQLADTGALIANGANAFILKVVEAVGAALLVLSLLVFALAEKESGVFYVTFAFIWGAKTSLLAGYISM
jgi:hypothetical protein